ncbi:MAG: PrgI family protein [bacterium]|nr:PrgI family protein [bacterium]
MRFQVPQFIEHEPKVIGPFTFRQFVYLGVPAAVAFFLYFLAPFFVFVIASIFLAAFGFMFAFIKIGGRELPTILLNFFNFTVGPKRYLWKKGETPLDMMPKTRAQPQVLAPEGTPKREIQLVQKSRLKDLAVKVETKK